MSEPTVGSMQLYDGVDPAVKDGLHAVESTLVIDSQVASSDLTSATHRDFVQIGGSPITLAATEIVSNHPPRNGTGAYAQELPHVVLRRRTLPLERSGPNGAPWLALLVFDDSEVSFAATTVASAVGPKASAAYDAESPGISARTADVVQVHDLGLLRAVLPTPAELALLSHVRRVNTSDANLGLNDADGWLAVVVANRLPVAPQPPTTYHACLVSVEHREDVYGPGPASTSLILLYRWDFIVDSGGTFAQLSKDLDVGVLGQTSTGVTDGHGRVTLTHIEREGTSGRATYRGPFTQEATQLPADAAGSDVSYDAAYELGRLMGAADGPFTRDLVEWHRTAAQAAQTAVQQDALRTVSAAHARRRSDLDGLRPHAGAAAAGLNLVLNNLAPPAPHRPVRATPTAASDG